MKILVLIFLSTLSIQGFSKVRTVEVAQDQIVKVKTAVGIATIIQVPDRPSSVVVGDSASFKIEYLDQAITIKPLMRSAKSNLYIMTDWRRFNVELITGQENDADYIVYLKHPRQKPRVKREIADEITWKNLNLFTQSNDFQTRILMVGISEKFLFIELKLKLKRSLEIDPSWFWVKQDGKNITIDSFALSKLNAKSNEDISALIKIKRGEVLSFSPLVVEIKKDKSRSSLKLPSHKHWR